jgi:hypothetical protein
MKVLLFVLMFALNSTYAQKTKQNILAFETDTVRNEYIVRIGDLGSEKLNVEVNMKSFNYITDYKGKSHKIEALNINQKVNTGGNVFFGGVLQEGLYIVTLSYTEKGKKLTKTIEKFVKK